MEKLLATESLPRWAARLEEYRLFAPVFDGAVWNYQRLVDAESLDLDYPNTIQSPKRIAFPQREALFQFHETAEGGMELRECVPAAGPAVVFGVRPCDAKALTQIDRVLRGERRDAYYENRRAPLVLAGLACAEPPSRNCFCLSMHGSPHNTDGLDVLLTPLDCGYHVLVLTPAGEAIVEAAAELFEAVTAEDAEAVARVHRDSDKAVERHLENLDAVPARLAGMFEAPLWEEESRACIGCGVCTYLCPSCHCFDINDEVVGTVPLRGERVRTWDTCQFPDFTMHSSGHNPRDEKAARLRQRVMHKFNYFVERHGEFQCTGCGRCIDHCPEGIDLIDVVGKVADA